MKYYKTILILIFIISSCSNPERNNLEGEKYTARKEPKVTTAFTVEEIHSVLEFYKDSVDIYITHDSIRTTNVIHRIPYSLNNDTLILSKRVKGIKRGDTLIILDEQYIKQ
jgi:hypothetical protein